MNEDSVTAEAEELTLESICRQYDTPLFPEIGFTLGDDLIDWQENVVKNVNMDFNDDKRNYCMLENSNECYQSSTMPVDAPLPAVHPTEPIKLSIHEADNGHYSMQYEPTSNMYNNLNNNGMNMQPSYNPYSYISSPEYRQYIETLKQKILNNESDMFCHVCNYGFKSFPRLIRHMETKRHAIQIERFRSMSERKSYDLIYQQQPNMDNGYYAPSYPSNEYMPSNGFNDGYNMVNNSDVGGEYIGLDQNTANTDDRDADDELLDRAIQDILNSFDFDKDGDLFNNIETSQVGNDNGSTIV